MTWGNFDFVISLWDNYKYYSTLEGLYKILLDSSVVMVVIVLRLFGAATTKFNSRSRVAVKTVKWMI